MSEKIKCYELDFGDTNLVSENSKDILDWIEAEMSNLLSGDSDELNYTIKIKELTRRQLKNLPEWS